MTSNPPQQGISGATAVPCTSRVPLNSVLSISRSIFLLPARIGPQVNSKTLILDKDSFLKTKKSFVIEIQFNIKKCTKFGSSNFYTCDMTLVKTEDNISVLPIMLTVQQQHHRPHGHNIATIGPNQSHRGNVIVSTGGLTTTQDVKIALHQQQSCKRSKMYQTTPYGTVPHQPASVARRNARERNRVKQVNNGFATLRQHIPQSVAQALGGNTAGTHGGSRAGSKKLSKVETLRMAVEYIRSLQRLLDDHDGSDITGASPSSSTSSGSSSSLMSRGSGPGCEPDHHSTVELRLHGSSDFGHQQHNLHHLRQNPSPGFAPTPCSEASSSPTPSFVSEASSAGSQGYGTSSAGTLYATHNDTYDMYEPTSPEDEELLDCISWWQQSQG